MRGERCEPLNSKVVNPDNKDWQIDGGNCPQHDDEDGMSVIIEVVVSARASLACKP